MHAKRHHYGYAACAEPMCARMVWVFDEAKGIWVQRAVFTPEAQWELEGIEETRLPRTYYNVTPTYRCAAIYPQTNPSEPSGDGSSSDDEPGGPSRLVFGKVRWGIQGTQGMGHNARLESLHRVPRWRGLWGSQHAVVVCDGFYEWDDTTGRKQPYYFSRHDEQPLAFAALVAYDGTDPKSMGLAQVSIITCPPNGTMEPYHDRMPVVLEAHEVAPWLAVDPKDPEGTRGSLKELLDPASDDVLRCHPVTTDVNKSTNNRPDLVDPIALPGGRQQSLF